jgi:hypothetical protein
VAGTLEAVIWQMIAHNSYHTEQIAMMRQMLGGWPPRGGGDTWQEGPVVVSRCAEGQFRTVYSSRIGMNPIFIHYDV